MSLPALDTLTVTRAPRTVVDAVTLGPGECVGPTLPGRDLKPGVLMALLGAPLFLHLIYRTSRNLEGALR